MKFVFLSRQFYEAYSGCREIEQKDTRPYVQVYTEIGGYTFAIPLRSNINHIHVLWTDKPQKCGVDFSKAVIVINKDYIDKDCKPRIRQNEFDALRGKDYIIKTKMIHYIQTYQKAKKSLTSTATGRFVSIQRYSISKRSSIRCNLNNENSKSANHFRFALLCCLS